MNQVEPPSLESSGIVFGSYEDEPSPRPVSRKIKMRRLTQARKPGLRSIKTNNGIIAEAPSKTGGWRVVSRSLADKKCASAPKTRAIAPPQTRVLAQAPKVRMIDRKKVETPLKVVSRVHLAPENAEEVEKDLKPNVREKVTVFISIPLSNFEKLSFTVKSILTHNSIGLIQIIFENIKLNLTKKSAIIHAKNYSNHNMRSIFL